VLVYAIHECTDESKEWERKWQLDELLCGMKQIQIGKIRRTNRLVHILRDESVLELISLQ
jgi:hypothetical protein